VIGKQLRSPAVGITAFNLAIVVPDGVLARPSVHGRGDADDFSTETPIRHNLPRKRVLRPAFQDLSPRRNLLGRNPVSCQGRHGIHVPVVSDPT
jgi:hypothetical protein